MARKALVGLALLCLLALAFAAPARLEEGNPEALADAAGFDAVKSRTLAAASAPRRLVPSRGLKEHCPCDCHAYCPPRGTGCYNKCRDCHGHDCY